jgi:hypothetical protein
MILLHKITIEDLSKVGKNYKWPINRCDDCRRNMWGHGYVSRYFTASVVEVYLKRYRCPGCRSVVTVRPEGHWPRIRSSILVIYEALKSKLSIGRWPALFPRQRGGHWLNRFVRFVAMEAPASILLFLDHCHQKEIRFLP